ncbi:MAG: bifunctional oligoribonuclease/PAP phosphatase NrnA [Patescibacteria group bacterium]|nr:bifunctional oligoribonuclease/PAP phosphatase NrnA [Patescibacteria group bacterium]MDE2172498.1 bifunctional oligoribonuclease/PAP phosphatase NrnA [Patescibacteria group bacterium]
MNEIQAKAPVILAEIQKANSILLHCHPSPDPDSVGSALAMKFTLEQMGKKVTVISSDSDIPRGFNHFPGITDIQRTNFFELDLKKFDLFIIQDSGSSGMISRFKPITFPLPIRTIVIDHHVSNPKYADINLVESSYPATAQLLFELFLIWDMEMTHDIAANLFMGIYSDTGGFKYPGTTSRTFACAGKLIEFVPEFPKLISDMENSNTPGFITFEALALNSIRTFLNGTLGFSIMSNKALADAKIPKNEIRGDAVSPILRSVENWLVTAVVIELEPGNVKISFRSKDGDMYDVSKLASMLGGGGHAAASGATLMMPIEDAVSLVVAKAKDLYNL